MRHVAVIDIGKTNAKVALVDLTTRAEVAVRTRPNAVLPGPPWPHFDTEGLWDFVTDALTSLHRLHGIEAISITTHGACAALLDAAGGLAAPVLDYEHSAIEETRAAYDRIRPPFDETGSAPLQNGLNIGAQLFWMFQTDPALKDRTARMVTWPQYWAHRLTGRAAMDVTSLGCHTDLWDPWRGTFSSLVARLGLTDRMAEVHAPDDVLGPILPQVAAQTGLNAATPVLCGIHDSNASLVPHLMDRSAPFAVVSTGTWVVSMAIGGLGTTLDPARDALVNVNAFGTPVPSARFMGGREHDIVLKGQDTAFSPDDAARVLARPVMLMPSVMQGCGPFPHRTAKWTVEQATLSPGERAVAVAYYLALMTAECLSMIGAEGPVIVEGPFARNRPYAQMLASAVGRPVLPSAGQTGTAVGAALLFLPRGTPTVQAGDGAIASESSLARYARQWRDRMGD